MAHRHVGPRPNNALEQVAQLTAGGQASTGVAYWNERATLLEGASGAAPRLPLRCDQDRAGARATVPLAPETAQAMQTIAGDKALGRLTLILAATSVLLSRYTDRDVVCIRAALPEEDAPGGAAVLVERVRPNDTMRTLVGRVRDTLMRALRYRATLDLLADQSKQRLNQVQATVGFSSTSAAATGLTVRISEGADVELRVDLEVGLMGDAAPVARHLGACLAQLSALDVGLANVELSGEPERALLLESWNDTAVPYPHGATLVEIFEEQVRNRGDALAVVGHAAPVELTYAELNGRANRIARYLKETLGVRDEDRVGVLLHRSVELVVVLLGILKAGGVYVPIDPDLPPERSTWMLEDCGARAIVLNSELLQQVPATLPMLVLDIQSEELEALGGRIESRASTGQQLACLMYTSGSTGRPKAVAVTQQGIVRLLHSVAYVELTSSEVVLHAAPPAFDASTFEIWGALLHGAMLVVLEGARPTVEDYLGVIERHGVSVAWFTAGLFHLLADERPEGLAAVRQLLVGGEVVSAAHVQRLRGEEGAVVVNGYGPTESTTFACCNRWLRGTPLGATFPIGKPIANTRVYVVDRALRLLPPGIQGEICIGGDGVARGYAGRPELTAERFLPDPWGLRPGARLYRTGDLGYWTEDGMLEYSGRSDHQLKLRGYRIELGEIEHVLSEHPAVATAVLTVEREGYTATRLCAHYVLTPGETVVAEQLRTWLAARVPQQMVPSRLMEVEAFPLTANGKVDRAALATLALNTDNAYAEPQTELERTLCDVWAGVLQEQPIGREDNFFSRGGDSLNAIQVVARLAEQGLQLAVQDLFECQTVRELAERVQVADGSEPADSPERVEAFALVKQADRERLPADAVDAYPLTRLQAGMLFHSHGAQGGVYHDIFSFHLEAPLERGLLEGCFRSAVAAHPVLRTAFDLASYSEPLQVVLPSATLELSECSLEGLARDEQARQMAAFVAAEKERGFVWDRPPLMRVHVHRRKASSFQLTIAFHHAILDGWSFATFLTGLLRDYAGRLRGEGEGGEAPLLGGSFAEFVALERQALGSEEAKRYWGGLLAELPGLVLPAVAEASTGSLGELEEETVGTTHVENFSLLPGLSSALHKRAQQLGVPVKSLLLTAHMKALATMTGKMDVVSGVVGHGRPETAHGEKALGLFLNTLPFRLRLSRGTFADLARSVFERERTSFPHRRFPLADIQRLCGTTDFFDCIFNFVHFHVYRELDKAEAVRVIDTSGFEQTNYPMVVTCSVNPDSKEIAGGVRYSPNRLPRMRARAFVGFYERALEQLAYRPEGLHHRTSLFEVKSGAHPIGYPQYTRERDDSVPERVLRWAHSRPSAPAVVTGEQVLDYGTLVDRAKGLGSRLAPVARGEACVAVLAERSSTLVIAALGSWLAGAAYLPIDPAQPRERVRQLLHASGAVALVKQAQLAGFDGLGVECIELDEQGGVLCGVSQQVSSERHDLAWHAEQLAYVIFTSGSTGQPKGVAVEHRALCNLVDWHVQAYAVTERTRGTLIASPGFDASVWEIWPHLCAGAALHIPEADLRQDVPGLVAWLETHGIDVSFLPTPLAEEVLRWSRSGQRELPLRYLLTGGDRLLQRPGATLQGSQKRTQVINHYGPTEGAVVSTAGLVTPGVGVPNIGAPITNVQVHVLDAFMERSAPGAEGELYIGGESLARGYLHDPRLTATRFLPDPYSVQPGARLYRSGDRVRHDRVWSSEVGPNDIEPLVFVGRDDAQLKVRGYRVEPVEVELALRRVEDAIHDVVVTARDGGKGQRRLVAYVVFQPGTPPVNPGQLLAALGQYVPHYMVPAAVIIVERIPRTLNGKVDFGRLPEPEEEEADQVGLAPRTELESNLADIWRDVLGVPRLGVTDDFFALGGDSILSIQVVARASARGLMLRPRDLFEARTIEALAPRVRGAVGPRGQAWQRQGAVPLTPIQRWFWAQSFEHAHHFNQALVLEVRRTLPRAHLAAALNVVVAAHDVFQLGFAPGPDAWDQVYAEASAEPRMFYDVLSADAATPWQAVLAERAQELQGGFRLDEPPLLGAVYVACERTEERRLLLAAHHLVVDAVSWRILIEDLERAIDRLEADEVPSVASPSSAYGEWAQKLHAYAHAEALREELPYWRGIVIPSVEKLPRLGGGVNTVQSESTAAGALSEDETSALIHKIVQAHRASVEAVLLASLGRQLGRWVGTGRIRIALEAHGREELFPEVDLFRTVGWFTAMYPFLLELSGADGMVEAVRRVRRRLAEVPRRGVGYGVLRYAGVAQDALPTHEAPEVSFNYLGQFDQVLRADGLFGPASEPTGSTCSPLDRRAHVLDVVANVVSGRLHVAILYSRFLHRSETIEKLVEGVLADVRGLLRQDAPVAAVPADFPRANLKQRELDRLIRRWGGGKNDQQ